MKMEHLLIGIVIGIVLAVLGMTFWGSTAKCHNQNDILQLFEAALLNIKKSIGNVTCKLDTPSYQNRIWYETTICEWSKVTDGGFTIVPNWSPRINMIVLDDAGWTVCDNRVYYTIDRI